MKKLILLVVCTVFALTLSAVSKSEAKGTYGDDVDAFCLDSNPFNGNCELCHVPNDKKKLTTSMTEYKSGNLCYFCSTDTNCTDTGPLCVDGDGDGFFATDGCGTPVDCNDNDRSINPGLAEDCSDTKDNDCNGLIDSQDPACGVIDCTDNDGDGFSIEGGLCGTADCNDGNPDIYPGATDTCNDGIDQDCSGKDRTKGKGCKTTDSVRPEGKGKTCSDGLDNDGDGLTDCDDDGCYGNRACR